MQLSVEALDDLVMLINNRSLEKDKRILLAAAAKAYGHGGEKRVKDLTGMAFSTLRRGRNEPQCKIMGGCKPLGWSVCIMIVHEGTAGELTVT